MWLMLQQPEPDDFVLATGNVHSVQDFCELVARWHNIKLEWQGKDVHMKGINAHTGQIIYESVPEFYRPAEVDLLQGDAHKAKTQLNWHPEITFDHMVSEMCDHDWQLTAKEHS